MAPNCPFKILLLIFVYMYCMYSFIYLTIKATIFFNNIAICICSFIFIYLFVYLFIHSFKHGLIFVYLSLLFSVLFNAFVVCIYAFVIMFVQQSYSYEL